MKNRSVLCFFLVLSVCSLICDVGFCFFPGKLGKLKAFGGLQNKVPANGDVDSIGRFAVEEHNKKTNAMLEFSKIVKAEEQVVSGKMYHLTLKALNNGKTETYEASVWVKPWLNFKQLQEFKEIQGVS